MLPSRSIRSFLLVGSCLLVLGSECDPELLEFVCANDPANPACREEKIVFVTSSLNDGNLGGLAGGDAICNDAAANSSVPAVAAGTYVAWLSTSAVDARDRLTNPSGLGFIRPDGRVVAASITDLTDGVLTNPIRLDENSVEAGGGGNLVYTGTMANGVAAPLSFLCDDWTSADPNVEGLTGVLSATDFEWTATGSIFCDSPRPLYCFET